eukprot:2834510-Rhodomonas_salina.1
MWFCVPGNEPANDCHELRRSPGDKSGSHGQSDVTVSVQDSEPSGGEIVTFDSLEAKVKTALEGHVMWPRKL